MLGIFSKGNGINANILSTYLCQHESKSLLIHASKKVINISAKPKKSNEVQINP